jgi:hypothetical protein
LREIIGARKPLSESYFFLHWFHTLIWPIWKKTFLLFQTAHFCPHAKAFSHAWFRLLWSAPSDRKWRLLLWPVTQLTAGTLWYPSDMETAIFRLGFLPAVAGRWNT